MLPCLMCTFLSISLCTFLRYSALLYVYYSALPCFFLYYSMLLRTTLHYPVLLCTTLCYSVPPILCSTANAITLLLREARGGGRRRQFERNYLPSCFFAIFQMITKITKKEKIKIISAKHPNNCIWLWI